MKWRVCVAQASLSLALGLLATVAYSALFATLRVPWLAVDLAVIAAATGLAYALRSDLIGVWGARAWRRAVLAGCWCLVIVLAQRLLVPDDGYIGSAERAYLDTLHAGRIIRDAPFPFSARWLAPLLAGSWNILPTTDADALKALNCGGLVLTAFWLIALLERYRVPDAVAAIAPLYVLGSYLGMYAGIDRLLLDPINYALFVALAHFLLRPGCELPLAATLMLTAFNTEKVVYWFPVIAVSAWLPTSGSWRERLTRSLRTTLLACGAVIAYLVGLQLYLTPSERLSYWIPENLVQITNLLFPFGALTLFAVAGFVRFRRMRPIAVLLLPIYASVVIATDARRMVAYAFIVLAPLAFAYLGACVTTRLSRLLFAACVIIRVATLSLWVWDPPHHQWFRAGLLDVELALAGALILHARAATVRTSAGAA